MTEFQSVSSMKVRREGSEGVLLKNCSFQHVFIWRFEQSSEEKRQTGELAWSFFWHSCHSSVCVLSAVEASLLLFWLLLGLCTGCAVKF